MAGVRQWLQNRFSSLELVTAVNRTAEDRRQTTLPLGGVITPQSIPDFVIPTPVSSSGSKLCLRQSHSLGSVTLNNNNTCNPCKLSSSKSHSLDSASKSLQSKYYQVRKVCLSLSIIQVNPVALSSWCMCEERAKFITTERVHVVWREREDRHSQQSLWTSFCYNGVVCAHRLISIYKFVLNWKHWFSNVFKYPSL